MDERDGLSRPIPKSGRAGVQFEATVPTFEDKVAQRAVSMVLEAIYEQDFLPCSYGFRPGRSAHQALNSLDQGIWTKRLYWVLELDIRKYFDSAQEAVFDDSTHPPAGVSRPTSQRRRHPTDDR